MPTKPDWARDADLGISPEMASRLPADLLQELRTKPRKSKPKPLAESRRDFEEQQKLERWVACLGSQTEGRTALLPRAPSGSSHCPENGPHILHNEKYAPIGRYDPFANDPVVQALRDKPENYVPEILRVPPLTERKPHERLLKPPIQTLINRKPPAWEDARRQMIAYTKKQIRLGLAPEGILRTLEPGPWDHDPAFWGSGSRDHEGTMDYEIVED